MRGLLERWAEYRHQQRQKKALSGNSNSGDAHAYLALAGAALVLAVLTVDRVSVHLRRSGEPVPVIPRENETASSSPTKPSDTPSTVATAVTSPLFSPSVPAEEVDENVARKRLAVLANDDGWKYFQPLWGKWDKKEKKFISAPRIEDWGDVPMALETLVDDPNGRLEADFRPPSYIRERVLFWLSVHVVFGNQMRVIHDRRLPGLTYGHFDFRSVYKLAGRAALGDSWALRLEKKAMTELKERIAESAGLGSPGDTKATKEEREALRAFLAKQGVNNPQAAMGLIQNLRSQTGQRDEVIAAMRRSRDLLPHIETTFRRENMPVALGRIPFVESSFNVRARSKVGAVGIWQFMPATARQYISKDDPKLWADPLRQTISAARMLRLLRGLLPDWSTTVTAYNSGVGRLQKLAKKHHARSMEPILAYDGETGLGFAGKNFYAEFLSVNLAEAYRRELFHRHLDRPELAAVLRPRLPFQKQRCETKPGFKR